jgi:hypothetical protein
MVKLSSGHPAMSKFGRYLLSKYNSDENLKPITEDLVTLELQPYNAFAKQNDGWFFQFATEQDLTFFLLKYN